MLHLSSDIQLISEETFLKNPSRTHRTQEDYDSISFDYNSQSTTLCKTSVWR